jgi:polysaccharide export outer membrane protein
MSRLPLLGLAAAVALGCAEPSFARTANSSQLPAPSASDIAAGAESYRIGAMDKLNITVFQVKDLTGTVDVDSSGAIQLPLVGSVQASGRTTDAVAKDISTRLSAGYVKDPQVTVTINTAVSQKATVGGAVSKPGVYPIPGHTTLTAVVALAGGTDPQRANDRQVRLIRTVNGKRVQATYNLSEIEKGSVADPEIYGNDTVIVGTSGGRSFLRDLATVSPLFYLLRPF